MDASKAITSSKNQKIVYVRPILARELPKDVQDQIGGAETVYGVHNEDGEQLALVGDETLAFVLARQNDLAPVHVH